MTACKIAVVSEEECWRQGKCRGWFIVLVSKIFTGSTDIFLRALLMSSSLRRCNMKQSAEEAALCSYFFALPSSLP